MAGRVWAVASLLFFSGLCALVYQVAWLRELRLVFGASTPASAAVLAVFMGGLGFGSLLLGKRADRTPRPLLYYSWLEIGISASAAVSPLLLDVARWGYVATGGSTVLGPLFGTVVRLILSALVLLAPTLLMGGTLPAAARAAITPGDVRRKSTAFLYGVNTLGAVTGALLSTFLLLEVFGIRFTLWFGCLLNLLVAMTARFVDRQLGPGVPPAEDAPAVEELTSTLASEAAPAETNRLERSFVLAAAAATGFVFLLMELVWYRMLSPLLGGSAYTFGLILAVALAGIGLGGLLYTLHGSTRPATMAGFAASSALEALALAIPFALGDRIALLALSLRKLGVVGLWGYAVGWVAVAAICVLPAALVAGYQFPQLIALLGRGERAVGRDVGLAYAFNTAGAIAGSLAGGFFLMPLLSAPGSWRVSVALLVALAFGAAYLAGRVKKARFPAPAVVLGALAVVGVHAVLGPTAVWRHSPIGAGRADDQYFGDMTRNGLRHNLAEQRRAIVWDADGRESTVGVYALNEISFLVNGKSDGAAVIDGGTQVMGGLLGALLRHQPVKRALVIGLGTGSTAGWLGQLPDVERVDVVELEPAILTVARMCSPVNRNVLDNPKVRIIIGDAREVLLTTPERYDLIFSEPSNPYRAGVASLFTKEFYEAVRARLTPGGVFTQWVQAYEIDAKSIRVIYATLSSVFGSVDSWRTKYSDLALVSRETDEPLDLELLRRRVEQSPFREALLSAWRATSVEAVIARYVARPDLARAIAEIEGKHSINTDDRNILEFSIARALGRPHDFSVDTLIETAISRGESRPVIVGDASVDWERVTDHVVQARIAEGSSPGPPPGVAMNDGQSQRMRALQAWFDDRASSTIEEWNRQTRAPETPVELLALADAHAVEGHAEAEPLIGELEKYLPIEADAVRVRLAWARNDLQGAWQAYARAFTAYREDPWPNGVLMGRIYPLAQEFGRRDATLLPKVLELLQHELAVRLLHYLRVDMRLDLGIHAEDAATCQDALREIGPNHPWYRDFLDKRFKCLGLAASPELAEAERDLAAFDADQGLDFGAGLKPYR
jgi:spermidine synthase